MPSRNPLPKRRCKWDGCCEFEPQSWNHFYCHEHKCKRAYENSVRRNEVPVPVGPELYDRQERRKQALIDRVADKNTWLLERKTFAFFDIESSNLSASIGTHLCASIRDRDTGETFTRSILDGAEICECCGHPAEYLDDSKMVVAIRDKLEEYDYIVTYYGTGFDIPYLNTRLIMWGERPIHRYKHIDLYYTARHKLKLHSNRLAVVCESLFGDSHKTRIVGPTWIRAVQGDPEAMAYIVKHCEIDVAELEKVFDRLIGFVNIGAKRLHQYGASC